MKAVLVSLCALLLLCGCASVQNLAPPDFPEKQLVKVRVVTEEESGRIKKRITVETLDGKAVDASKTYVAFAPGQHVIEMGFYKIVAPATPQVRVTLNVMGQETVLHEPDPSDTYTSTVPLKTLIDLAGGKSYCVKSTDNVGEAPTMGPSREELEMQKAFERSGINIKIVPRGGAGWSWTPIFTEEK